MVTNILSERRDSWLSKLLVVFELLLYEAQTNGLLNSIELVFGFHIKSPKADKRNVWNSNIKHNRNGELLNNNYI